jgi:hypothetical protein
MVPKPQEIHQATPGATINITFTSPKTMSQISDQSNVVQPARKIEQEKSQCKQDGG